MILTFDFPDAVIEQYAGELAEVTAQAGWQVEVMPEANQAALNALVRECLAPEWPIAKGPSMHRLERRVSVTVAPAEITAIRATVPAGLARQEADLALLLPGASGPTWCSPMIWCCVGP